MERHRESANAYKEWYRKVMIAEWLIREQNNNLILLCNGWGMDIHPFDPIDSGGYDVHVCYDYSITDDRPDIEKLSRSYEKVIMICWSIGVVYGQKIFGDKAHLFEKCIAVNGTLNPLDDDFGIPVDLFSSTLNDFNNTTQAKFYRRMCRPSKIVDTFLANKPERTLANQKEELKSIFDERLNLPVADSIYTHIAVSHKDLIVPTANQLRFWQNHQITSLNGAHFPFYKWRSWAEFIDEF